MSFVFFSKKKLITANVAYIFKYTLLNLLQLPALRFTVSEDAGIEPGPWQHLCWQSDILTTRLDFIHFFRICSLHFHVAIRPRIGWGFRWVCSSILDDPKSFVGAALRIKPRPLLSAATFKLCKEYRYLRVHH